MPPSGFYIAPHISWRNYELYITDIFGVNKSQQHLLGGGVIIGKQWILGKRFPLDIYLGPGYGFTTYKNGNINATPFVMTRLGICLGLDF